MYSQRVYFLKVHRKYSVDYDQEGCLIFFVFISRTFIFIFSFVVRDFKGWITIAKFINNHWTGYSSIVYLL